MKTKRVIDCDILCGDELEFVRKMGRRQKAKERVFVFTLALFSAESKHDFDERLRTQARKSRETL